MSEIEKFKREVLAIGKSKILAGYLRRRYFFESIVNIERRVKFLQNYILQKIDSKKALIRISFWQKSTEIIKLLQRHNVDKIEIIEYGFSENPGTIIIESIGIDSDFLYDLLLNHFNFEIAEEPSLNIRV